jgi:hypothetical protein
MKTPEIKIYGPEVPGYALLNEMQRLKSQAPANHKKVLAKKRKVSSDEKPA